jgi:hypothetical protein
MKSQWFWNSMRCFPYVKWSSYFPRTIPLFKWFSILTSRCFQCPTHSLSEPFSFPCITASCVFLPCLHQGIVFRFSWHLLKCGKSWKCLGIYITLKQTSPMMLMYFSSSLVLMETALSLQGLPPTPPTQDWVKIIVSAVLGLTCWPCVAYLPFPVIFPTNLLVFPWKTL